MFQKDIAYVKRKVITCLRDAFPEFSKEIDEKYLMVLKEGRYANATVMRYSYGNLNITVKDFSGSPFLIRMTYGIFATNRETGILKSLNGIPSVAQKARKISPYTLIFHYIEGRALTRTEGQLPSDFFVALSEGVDAIHKRNIVHLDLRNMGNFILGKDGRPYILDFQSGVRTRFMPKFLKHFLERIDLSGVYKCWDCKCGEELPPDGRKILEAVNRTRRFWILRGYPLEHLMRHLK